MKKQVQTIVLAALAGFTASDALAQKHQSTLGLASRVQPEWRTPIPRSTIHGELNGGELMAVEMLNHNVGWAIGSGRPHTILFRTADGGKSWERQTTFDGDRSRLTDIGFADANNGWIVGDDRILRTTDGGESWSPVDVGPEATPPDATKLLVLGPDAIVVGGRSQNRQIMLTVDGGATWELVGIVKDGGGGAGSENSITGLALAETSTIFATTGSHPYSKGRIYRSDDGGHSWEMVAEAEKPLHALAFRGKRGVAVGESIAFWTDDGGDTWRRVTMPGRRYGVGFSDQNTVLAVGRDPGVVVSGNGGKTWQKWTSPILEAGALIDVAAVDPGWVFMASTHALHHFVDPNHTEPIASGRIPIPVDVQLPGGRALPRGVYDVMLAHRGDQHVLKLDRKGEAGAAGKTATGTAGQAPTGTAGQTQTEASGRTQTEAAGQTPPTSDSEAPQEGAAELDAAVTRQKAQKPPACAQPCGATIPASVTYEKADVAEGKNAKSFFRISLEPTASGVAIVIRTAVTPPRNVALALAAAGAPESSEGEAGDVAKKAAAAGKGLVGRINPEAAQKRLSSAKAAPPAVYKVTLRHTVDLFGEKKK